MKSTWSAGAPSRTCSLSVPKDGLGARVGEAAEQKCQVVYTWDSRALEIGKSGECPFLEENGERSKDTKC